nr:hypothetical protein [Ligilactobacillus ruminis]
MIARMQTYSKTRNQSDVRDAQLQDKSNLFFTDVQVCGEYPKYLNRYFKKMASNFPWSLKMRPKSKKARSTI